MNDRSKLDAALAQAVMSIGAVKVTSVEEALAKMEKLPGEVYVTGGEQVYREFLPLASKLYLTEVAEKCDADAYFPDFLSDGEWEKMEENKRDGFSFVTYERNR